MKNNCNQIALILLFSLFCIDQITKAQTMYMVSNSKENEIKVSGTSSLHDWSMNAHIFTSEAQFDFNKTDNQQIVNLHSLTFSLPSTHLKSDKKGLDKNAYKALKTENHENIMYTLLSARVSPEKNNQFLIQTKGNLTIAGVTKEILMDVHCKVNNDAINCSGSNELRMTDYKVRPPTFMLGAMKTGDAVMLSFTMVYRQ
jgi:polyisoprenoid-binding protein YceI